MAIDYTTIEEIINDFQLMIDDTSYNKEANIYQLRLLALQGLRELTFDVEQKVKTTTLAVNSTTLQCTLPADYVKLNRVGYRGDDDEFHPLGSNPNLVLDASVTSQVGDEAYDENNPYYHTDIGKKFGVGGGKNSLGYYRVNRQDGTINFSSDVAGKTVFLEYISDGITSTPARDHIVRFTMKSSFDSGTGGSGALPGSILKIPSRDGSSITFGFNDLYTTLDGVFENLTSNPSNLGLYANLTGPNKINSIEIAKLLTNLINEGHPSFHVAPYDSNIKASNIGNKVTITISNLTSDPKDFLDPDETFDTNLFNNQSGVLPFDISVASSQELVQLGSVGDTPKIHKFCEEALRSYMYYKYIQRRRGIPANEKQMAKRAYYNEKRLARARMMNFNKETAMLTSRKAFKQSPKI
jgi:hypothetical protein|tara:strand:+ start:1639 stop:2871 length:1233 start_codon:yes stop_codon:yes gene_type:complete